MSRNPRAERAALLLMALVLAGCPFQLPVSPLVRFTAFGVPYNTQEDFQKRFQSWKSGKPQPWTMRLRATALSDSSIILHSDEPSSLGPKLVGGTGTTGQTFKPTRAELVKLVDDVLTTKVFDLYDGHYGAYDQGGGIIGPDIVIQIGGLEKHVSYDEDLSASTSWEAGAIQRTSEAIKALGLKYLKK